MKNFFFLMILSSIALSACSLIDPDADIILSGKRVDILTANSVLDIQKSTESINLPAPLINKEWAQPGGQTGHMMHHLALRPGPLNRIWSVDIGAGSSNQNPLTTQPVVSNGHIYAMDSESQLTCLDLQTGARKWSVFTGPKDLDDIGVGGGLSISGDRLYVANGYAEIVSLTTDRGQEVWRAALPAPARSAPTVRNNQIYVILIDGQVLALNENTGDILWSYRGGTGGSRLRGAPSPAASNDLVVVPFTSGELVALRPKSGAVLWADHLSPALRLGGLSTLADIRAIPVIASNIVIALSYADRLVAIDATTGARLWQKEIGGQDTPWVAGDYIFILTKTAQIVAIHLKTGHVRWVHDLDRFDDPDSKKSPIFWTGPIITSGVLRVAGTDGRMISLDPETGKEIDRSEIDERPVVPMVVVDETLLILDEDAVLSAWR